MFLFGPLVVRVESEGSSPSVQTKAMSAGYHDDSIGLVGVPSQQRAHVLRNHRPADDSRLRDRPQCESSVGSAHGHLGSMGRVGHRYYGAVAGTEDALDSEAASADHVDGEGGAVVDVLLVSVKDIVSGPVDARREKSQLTHALNLASLRMLN